MDNSRPPNPYSMGPDDFTPFDAYDIDFANQDYGFGTSTDLLGNNPDAAAFLDLGEYYPSDNARRNGYGDPSLPLMPSSYGQAFDLGAHEELSDFQPSTPYQARPGQTVESHDNLVPASNDSGPGSLAALAPYVTPSDVLCHPFNQSA